MPLWRTSLFLILLGIAPEVSAGKLKKEPAFSAPKISQLLRQGFTLTCQDCSHFQYTLAGTTNQIAVPCPDGQVCGPLDGAFTCIEADSPDASECSCGDIETGYIQDPYNIMKYYACLPGGEQVALPDCASDEFYTGDHNNPCAKAPKCESVGFSEFDCTQYYFCDNAAVTAGDTTAVLTCDAGKVWDQTSVDCVDPCSLAPADFTCDGKVDGAYPDTIDCGVFHLCFGGSQFTQQCDDGQFVNKDGICGADDADCPLADECYEEYKDTCGDSPSTTTTPVTTAETEITETTTPSTTTLSTTTTPVTNTDTSVTPTTQETTSTTTTTASTTKTSQPSSTQTTPDTTPTASDETPDIDCDKVNSPTYFAHNETCNKFYSCESDGTGGYEQKEYSCPGNLVFDPENKYCNLLNLVPSCQDP